VLRSRSRCNHEQAKSVGASPVVEAAPGNPPGLFGWNDAYVRTVDRTGR
jgi:hypothetical protein